MTDKHNLPAPRTGPELVRFIAEQYDVVPPDELEGRSMLRTLRAELATQVLAAPEGYPLDEMTGEPFWLQGIDFFTYSSVKGREDDLYAYLDCYWDNGAGFQATTGSGFVLARVHRLIQIGMLPRRVMSVLVESKKNAGQSSLWVVEAPLANTNGSVINAETVTST